MLKDVLFQKLIVAKKLEQLAKSERYIRNFVKFSERQK